MCYFKNMREWWDYGKIEVKVFCQQYTFNVSRDITRSMKKLEYIIYYIFIYLFIIYLVI